MRIHNKPSSQWRGREEVELIDDEVNNRKANRKKNEYASILFHLKRRLNNGLKDWHYRAMFFFGW